MRVVQVLAHSHHCLIQRQTGLDANDGQIERVRQPQPDPLLSLANHPLQDEPGNDQAERRQSNHKQRIVETRNRHRDQESQRSEKHSRALVVGNVPSIAQACLNQPEPRAGNVVSGERHRLAQWIQRLLDTLPHRLPRFGDHRLRTQCAQARAQHRSRRDHGRGKEEDRCGQRHPYDDCEHQNHDLDLNLDNLLDHKVPDRLQRDATHQQSVADGVLEQRLHKLRTEH